MIRLNLANAVDDEFNNDGDDDSDVATRFVAATIPTSPLNVVVDVVVVVVDDCPTAIASILLYAFLSFCCSASSICC